MPNPYGYEFHDKQIDELKPWVLNRVEMLLAYDCKPEQYDLDVIFAIMILRIVRHVQYELKQPFTRPQIIEVMEAFFNECKVRHKTGGAKYGETLFLEKSLETIREDLREEYMDCVNYECYRLYKEKFEKENLK
jgi:hypothetical protein